MRRHIDKINETTNFKHVNLPKQKQKKQKKPNSMIKNKSETERERELHQKTNVN